MEAGGAGFDGRGQWVAEKREKEERESDGGEGGKETGRTAPLASSFISFLRPR